VDIVLFILSRVLLALFAVGVIGCLIVIPATAFQLFKAVIEPDTDEETAGNTQKLQAVS
jgi:hypothetical protein